MKDLAPLDAFLKKNLNNALRVTKLRARKYPERSGGMIDTGDTFCGQVTLLDLSTCSVLAVDGGVTLRTSPIRDFVRKSQSKWLIKTANSIYKLELA